MRGGQRRGKRRWNKGDKEEQKGTSIRSRSYGRKVGFPRKKLIKKMGKIRVEKQSTKMQERET